MPPPKNSDNELAEAALLTRFGRAVIDRDVRPRAIVNARAMVLWSSPHATRMLKPPYPVYFQNRHLCFEEGHAADDGEAFMGAVSERRRRILLANRDAELWVIVSAWAERVAGERLLFLTFCLPEPQLGCQQSGLAKHFGLTRSEAAVLDGLANLATPRGIADDLGITLHTVRSHLKRLHAKLAVNSNSKLLQIVRAFADS